MTYSVPFGLKQKPLNHYFDGGVVKFSIDEGELHFLIKQITKKGNFTIYSGVITEKEQLDKLLSIKTLSELQTIEEVVS